MRLKAEVLIKPLLSYNCAKIQFYVLHEDFLGEKPKVI